MNQKQFKRPESVLVLIYTIAGEVLLLERVAPADFWQSVTGSLAWDESPLQAAERETREETGLEVVGSLIDCQITNSFPILPAWRSRYAPDTKTNTEYVFRIHYEERPEVRLNASEHSQFRWVSGDEAAEMASSWTNREAILSYLF